MGCYITHKPWVVHIRWPPSLLHLSLPSLGSIVLFPLWITNHTLFDVHTSFGIITLGSHTHFLINYRMHCLYSSDYGIFYSFPIRYRSWHLAHGVQNLAMFFAHKVQTFASRLYSFRLWHSLFHAHKVQTLAFSPWSIDSSFVLCL